MRLVEQTAIATWPSEGRALLRAVAALAGGIAVGATLALLGAAMPVAGAVGASLGLVGALGILIAGARRHPISVGADGLAVASGPRRFIAFADIERVERDDSPYGQTHHLAYLVLRSGKRVRLGGRHGILGHGRLRLVDLGFDDLERRLNRYQARKTAQLSATFARGERPSAAWIGELRARVAPGGFRDGTVVREELVAVVEDPTADPTARAGAAYALRASGLRDDERRRMRAAAALTAAPRVRIALDVAAEDGDDVERAAEVAARVEPHRS